MVDQNNSRNQARFRLSEEGAAFWKLDVEYRETMVRLVFPRGPEGPNELQTIVEGMPKILSVVLSETEIRDAMQNIDSDIEGLLGEAE
jgi:hypothetical protein